MRRAERRAAQREGRASRTLLEIDYLTLVTDDIRQGALRFREVGGAEFLAHGEPAIPPLVELPRLLAASENVLAHKDSDEDLRILLAPGSSLGGARPKAAVVDKDGTLAIAKFPHSGDEYQVELWSCATLSLARKAGLHVPAYRMVEVGEQRILLTQRFDRDRGQRIPFLSAMSMIAAGDNETHSYLELVDAIRRYGADVQHDLPELWRRVLFNVLVSNSDDHLRNHGFLYDISGHGWRLSPVYDLNPLPIDIKPRVLSLMIDDQESTATFSLVLEVGEYFGLTAAEMKAITREVATAVSGWRKVANDLGISRDEINRMASAFEHEETKRASEYGRAARTG